MDVNEKIIMWTPTWSLQVLQILHPDILITAYTSLHYNPVNIQLHGRLSKTWLLQTNPYSTLLYTARGCFVTFLSDSSNTM